MLQLADFLMYLSACWCALSTVVLGHGYLYDPPGRSSLHRWPQFRIPEQLKNYNDMGLGCYGEKSSIKCGVCGDPWDGPRDNEAGGKFALGIITRKYQEGQIINVRVTITASHNGYFEFNICPNNNLSKPITEECLGRYPLRMPNGATRYLEGGVAPHTYQIPLRLPRGLTCSQCVLRWKYTTDNNPGTNMLENFYGCSDVAIVERSTT